MTGVSRGLVGLVLFLSLVGSPAARAEPWRSSLHDLTYVVIEKRVRTDIAPPCPGCPLQGPNALEALPAEVLQGAGANSVEYESFLSLYLPEPAARALAAVAQRRGLAVAVGNEREIHLPWHTFTPGAADGRDDPNVTAAVPPTAVPGLYLVQFAYPIHPDWPAALEACGVHQIAYFQSRTLLVRASGLPAITGCSAARYLSWSESYRASDRIAPDLLTQPSPLGYWLQFPDGTDLAAKSTQLPSGLTFQGSWASAQDHVAYLRVQASPAALAAYVATDPDLLTVASQSAGAPSDERQGQIIAGNHGASSLCADPANCQFPRYKDWLTSRGLLTPTNQQTVAVIDQTGYDNGLPPTPGIIDHHPDMESPERLAAICGGGTTAYCYTTPSPFGDQAGHPTMVAGIIAADGSVSGATGGTDTAGYYNGMGIAPGAKIFSYEVSGGGLTDISNQQVALNYSRNKMEAGFADRAFIANNSWNEFKQDGSQAFVPKAVYDPVAQFYDNRVLDANTAVSGNQPMTLVFSAGNYAYNCVTQTSSWDSVSSPAVAKNVISVGASLSYRPAPDPPLACRGCFGSDGTTTNGRPPDEDATNLNLIASFSGRGRYFAPYPSTATANNTRIKPDLVAPGVRVFSTVPYQYTSYTSGTPTGCVNFYPSSPMTYHTYGTGTSFAAPVVSAAAAIARKLFLDQGISNPSPSLIKAALIATADDLGGFAGNEHRPSPLYGWGRVSLVRLTDSTPKKIVSATPASPTTNQVGVGQSIIYKLKVSDPAAPILVVLAWDDPASSTQSDSSAPLTNDLVLDVADGVYRGNFFNSNMTGTNDGWSYPFTFGVAANDTVNNVEAVFIPAGTFTTGTVVKVKVTGISMAPAAPQQTFALYAYNLISS
ncbi:MAG TPA: S8 family serine peptidase [Thermoanaerobaculia bacterium]|jgi:hypothetical protein|nr:S8 family serine peptidase [Thermoanaerobaculia bacterium]